MSTPPRDGAKEAQDGDNSQLQLPDFDALSRNVGRFVEEAGKVTAAFMRPIERGDAKGGLADEASDVVKTFGQVAENVLSDPQKAIEVQAAIATNFMSLWSETLKKMNGEAATPVAQPDPKDARFADAEWQANPMFDFIKQAYLITSRWAETVVDKADGVDEHTRDKARFYVKQISSALSPSNFIATNPELIRETLRQNGDNLVRGMKMLAEDVDAGKGELKVRMTDTERFEVGVNMAITPGKVVFRNALIELIQYAPTTETVLARPLVIVPPWINKYYILDLNPEKSFIKWCVAQGLTVFCVSWVNPDERHRNMGFDEYMTDGILAAVGAACEITGQPDVTAIGYCVGGTMMAVTLAYMAAQGDTRISSATLFTTQVDFTDPGELKVFVDEEQIKSTEEQMKLRGYLDGARMAGAFNMLRPNDLIWANVVNVYLKGQSPYPFDLLYWNSDSTRMPEKNHSFYLRNCYLNNTLSKGEMKVAGERLDMGKVTIPIFNLAAKEDHIAPAKSVFRGCSLFGGPVDYVMAGSGHIAGVVNPPSKPKYQYWTGGKAVGRFEDWVAAATETPGSWWPYWIEWIRGQAPATVKARTKLGSKTHKPLCDAPGTYVKIKA
ncbi:MAG: class I poly(R)-hydroxyalkanoic acid synthase [Hyphomicrobiales bacterium]|nr:class I poly(R)-hydroxyalkanoic acid synthase [Hyphomicrobiales bacterium]